MAWKDITKALPTDERHLIVFCDFIDGYQIEGWYCQHQNDFYDWDGEWLETATHWDEIQSKPNK